MTTIQQYGECYTGRWWVCYYIWYSQEGHGRAAAERVTQLCCTKSTADCQSGSHTDTIFIYKFAILRNKRTENVSERRVGRSCHVNKLSGG